MFLFYDRFVKQAGCHALLLKYALVQHEHHNPGYSLKYINGESCCFLTVALFLEKIPLVTEILKQKAAVAITGAEYKLNK